MEQEAAKMSWKQIKQESERVQYQTAKAKPENKRSWIDRNTIRVFEAKYGKPLEGVPVAEIKVMEFEDQGEMAATIQTMAIQGWTVQSQSAYTPKKGALRSLAGGFVFFNRKPRTTVTFARYALPPAETDTAE